MRRPLVRTASASAAQRARRRGPSAKPVAPLCSDCAAHLERGRLPPLSYANDLWTGYGLERIYKEQVTAIELVRAAPYLTSMIPMSMENRRKWAAEDPSVFNETAHMARHRFGARGNLITFPLPVEELRRSSACRALSTTTWSCPGRATNWGRCSGWS